MKDNDSKALFEKYVAGNCTAAEKAIVEGWLLQELNTETFRPTNKQINKAKDEVWKTIAYKSSNKKYVRYFAYAAAVLVVVFMVHKAQFSSNDLDSNLQKAAVGSDSKNVLKASPIENTMLKLPDSSIIILQKGSTLTLSADFNQRNREVTLVGKAFFDVKHQPKKPFIIYAGKLTTTVLGTSFDIEAQKGATAIKINVIRGKVKVENEQARTLGIISKNMQIVYKNQLEQATITQVDAQKELSWKKQDLEFNDISLEDAKSKLEEQFGYRFLIKDPDLGKQTFHYSMRSKESVESFTRSICAFIDAEYNVDHQNKTILIQHLNQ